MKGIGEIFKKEMARVFKDKKMIFSVFILPVVLMIGIMSLVSSFSSKMQEDISSHIPQVYVENMEESFSSYLKSTDSNYNIVAVTSNEEKEKAKKGILEGSVDVLIEFPADLEERITAYKEGDSIPQVKTYYNPSENYSQEAHSQIQKGTLEGYRQSLLLQRFGNLEQIAIFTVDTDNEDMVIQNESKASGKALGMMIPYFITLLLFAGAMGIGTDMIAGEKERGTMASLLVTPIKRKSIVLGKVLALMSISGISSMVYIIAMSIFTPLTMKFMTDGTDSSMKLDLNGSQIAMMGVLLIALAFLYSTIIAFVSVIAKNVKEASTYVMPVYMAVLVIGLMTMFDFGKATAYTYVIPIYNSSMAFKGILAQEITMGQYGLTLGVTILCGLLLSWGIVKAFESEKIMAQ